MNNEIKNHEGKIRKFWDKEKIFEAKDFDKSDLGSLGRDGKPKFYCLDMFPYPSGEGLHIGHIEGYTASDIFSRYKKMQGFNVLHPMGWDAFGLPAENYAIKTKTHPRDSINKNVANFKRQLDAMGFGYDWSREINTTDPEYYRWTQWIFLKLYERGLAYEADVPVNWCTKDKVVLADEEVVNGHCERDGAEVVKKNLKQWMLKITAYADRLLEDLDDLDWPGKIKEMQRNWIGRSSGSLIKFEIRNSKSETISKSKIKNSKQHIEIFTTRPDTLFGVTYLVVAPEHNIISNLKSPTFAKASAGRQISNLKEVEGYIEKARNKSDLERTGLAKDKTGVELKGIKAINPANGEEVPVWVADYVLGSYGTGAVMAVPAHDQRDFEFAKKYKLPITQVISKNGKEEKLNGAYEDAGILINSEEFNGFESEKAKAAITESLIKRGTAKKSIQYKLRDWVFSRQRFWGEPIPIVKCPVDGNVPVEEKDLPVELPKVKYYKPTDTGQSPLAGISDWVNVKCPRCGRAAKRETNTMPQWAGSSWYFLAYLMRGNSKFEIRNSKLFGYWLPVDLYIGGAEHAVLHLLYARFWTKFLYDIGICPVSEPFEKLVNQGIILASDGRKMSKSLGNVVNPEAVIAEYNADTLRLYEMFMGPLEDSKPWSTKGILGVKRFLDRIAKLKVAKEKVKLSSAQEKILNLTIRKVTDDIENLRYNTAISAMMVLLRELESMKKVGRETFEIFLKLLSPFAPFTAEYLWLKLGNKKSIFNTGWPKAKEVRQEKKTTIVVQINGKLRDTFETESESEKEIVKKALGLERVRKFVDGKKPKQIIYIPRRLVNFVV